MSELEKIVREQAFILSRREQISGVDARNARPLSADKRAELAPFLAAKIVKGLSRCYFAEIILGS